MYWDHPPSTPQWITNGKFVCFQPVSVGLPIINPSSTHQSSHYCFSMTDFGDRFRWPNHDSNRSMTNSHKRNKMRSLFLLWLLVMLLYGSFVKHRRSTPFFCTQQSAVPFQQQQQRFHENFTGKPEYCNWHLERSSCHNPSHLLVTVTTTQYILHCLVAANT